MPRLTPWNAPAAWIATGLGLTASVPAPGSVGALLGVPLWLAITLAPGFWWQVGIAAMLAAIGGPLCGRAARELVALGRASDADDPQAITYDEFTTVPLVYLFAPAAAGGWLVVGFALHRLLDITKPWPCRVLERLPGGWGIMADDVMAALYAGAIYRAVWAIWG